MRQSKPNIVIHDLGSFMGTQNETASTTTPESRWPLLIILPDKTESKCLHEPSIYAKTHAIMISVNKKIKNIYNIWWENKYRY